jgi:ABC-type multidrug transport system fused ATPase/permease subunit
MVDKMDIKSLHLARMRSFISVVSQEPILFNCSIRDNIAYGLENEAGMDDVIEAARSANIHEFITGLPMVYTFSNTTCLPTHVKVSMYTCHKPQSLQELLFFVLTSTSANVSNNTNFHARISK